MTLVFVLRRSMWVGCKCKNVLGLLKLIAFIFVSSDSSKVRASMPYASLEITTALKTRIFHLMGVDVFLKNMCILLKINVSLMRWFISSFLFALLLFIARRYFELLSFF